MTNSKTISLSYLRLFELLRGDYEGVRIYIAMNKILVGMGKMTKRNLRTCVPFIEIAHSARSNYAAHSRRLSTQSTHSLNDTREMADASLAIVVATEGTAIQARSAVETHSIRIPVRKWVAPAITKATVVREHEPMAESKSVHSGHPSRHELFLLVWHVQLLFVGQEHQAFWNFVHYFHFTRNGSADLVGRDISCRGGTVGHHENHGGNGEEDGARHRWFVES